MRKIEWPFISGSHLVPLSGTVSNVGRGSPKKHSCEIISKSIHWLRRRRRFKVLFLALAAIFSPERNGLSNFGRGSPKEHSCEIISKSIQWLRRRSCLKVFLFLALAAIFSSEWNGLSNFGRVTQRTFMCNYFKICSLVKDRK